jgi:hypothetical protein
MQISIGCCSSVGFRLWVYISGSSSAGLNLAGRDIRAIMHTLQQLVKDMIALIMA